VYGDSTRRDTLLKARTGTAGYLILASAAMQGSEEIIRIARELNPRIRILARASYLRDLPALRNAGADVAFSGEGEVALAFTEEILRELGASAEQIDRERARVRESIVVEPRR
jgi:CPA2 family monovalent cation:H+ antiporter-2